ncbi:hypothetical protein AB0M48_35255 [Lentzea sp. NPDC051208]|uniref:hypothetical protein n=1 Tax=Lentzea sp. NPDC051208 TaxID=3154642 RepID=UPI00342B1041
MPRYEASVPVYFQRIYLGNSPMPLEDSPFEKHDFESLAVSAGDAIGLNSITSNHTAHVTLEVFDSPAEVPAEVRKQPTYWFTSSAREFALIDTEGGPAVVLPALPAGRVVCSVSCTGRDEAYAARHHQHQDDVRDIERWHIWMWPEA